MAVAQNGTDHHMGAPIRDEMAADGHGDWQIGSQAGTPGARGDKDGVVLISPANRAHSQAFSQDADDWFVLANGNSRTQASNAQGRCNIPWGY